MGTDIILPNRADDSVIDLSMSIIFSKIYQIRGLKVILDRDLAPMYEVTTFNLNKAVNRNIERFPDDFMFQLNREEFNLIFQNGISSWGGTRKLPYAFTEHGVAMLAGLLNSEKAIDANIKIVRAFVALRHQALTYAELKHELELYMNKTDRKIDDIYNILDAFFSAKEDEDKPRNPIGFKQKNN